MAKTFRMLRVRGEEHKFEGARMKNRVRVAPRFDRTGGMKRLRKRKPQRRVRVSAISQGHLQGREDAAVREGRTTRANRKESTKSKRWGGEH